MLITKIWLYINENYRINIESMWILTLTFYWKYSSKINRNVIKKGKNIIYKYIFMFNNWWKYLKVLYNWELSTLLFQKLWKFACKKYIFRIKIQSNNYPNSVVVITFPLHGKGLRFEPGFGYWFIFCFYLEVFKK